MISEMDPGFDTEPSPSTSYESDSYLKIRPSLRGYDSITDSSTGLDELESSLSCASSVCDDSGFNTDSEERDDIVDGVYRGDCSFDDDISLGDIIEIRDISDFQSSECIYSKFTSSETTDSQITDLSSSGNKIFELNSNFNSEQCPVNEELTNDDESSNCCSSDKKNIKSSRASNQLNTPANSRLPGSPRTSRHRRNKTQDINNNDTRPRPLRSYLRKSSFRLQDCFHNKGLLSLIACIIYTLILMVVLSVLHAAVQYLKYLIGADNLKSMRDNIVESRREQTTKTSG